MTADRESAAAELRRECEEGLTAIALVDTSTAVTRVAGIVSPFDFADGDLGAVYGICCDLADAGVANDPHAVGAELRRRGCTEKLGMDFLQRLLSRNYATANAEYYARNIARLAKLRRIARAARNLVGAEFEADAEPAELLASFDAATQGLSSDRDAGLVSFADAVRETIAVHREALENGKRFGMQTGFPTLDAITGGFHRGQLVLLGGRTFQGKTAIALAFASYFATKRRPTLFVSLEMTRTELTERILADDCGFELRQFTQAGLTHQEVDSIDASLPHYREWPLTFSDCSTETTRTIRAKAKLLQATRKLDLLVVDNLQLVQATDRRQERRLQLTEITGDMKRLAKELDCVVLLLCQLNADAEGNEPDDRHYAESKQILADADIAMLAHRTDKTAEGFLVKVTKNRRGTQGRVMLQFDGAYQRFTDPMFVESGREWQS